MSSAPTDDAGAVESWLRDRSVGAGDELALALRPGVGLGLATTDTVRGFATGDPVPVVERIDRTVAPRWVWWERSTSDLLAAHGIEIDRSWDVLTVHRLLHGGWRTSVAECWAWLYDLDAGSLPTMGQLDLLATPTDEGTDPEQPVRPDGHLRPEWVGGGWGTSPSRLAAWARACLVAAGLQRGLLAQRPFPERALMTARSESAAEFLCAELEVHGLPIDVAAATRIIADAVGSRPSDERDAAAQRHRRDEAVLQHLDPGPPVDLRNPADVKSMLRRVAVDVPDTRAWRLEQHRDTHPLVPALLTWRKAERIATTYGYRWLDEHVTHGRLVGSWSSSDGAAGRMTASAGLHNLPGEMRPAVAAEAGHRFVRADLGQIEPRVLAAVSGDTALVAATADDDLYQPVADRLGVDRAVAKVAVLGAMYGATTGESAHALRGLERAYPTAMGYLERAAEAGRAGQAVTTVGGRLVHMWVDDSIDGDIDRARRVAAARGRYARNATIQGAAAEFFKVWAVLVRSRGRSIGARIVLCLHDELIVHVPEAHADAAVRVLHEALDEAAHRWSPHPEVRFLADLAVIRRWSEAKD
ncbi:DNA polymerase [Ilumatobacter sp.]|uniref:DNA polymerase n=1 Tax=Ilumatobacter sp. TaxID=1967498 RepID=UPI003AF9EB6D